MDPSKQRHPEWHFILSVLPPLLLSLLPLSLHFLTMPLFSTHSLLPLFLFFSFSLTLFLILIPVSRFPSLPALLPCSPQPTTSVAVNLSTLRLHECPFAIHWRQFFSRSLHEGDFGSIFLCHHSELWSQCRGGEGGGSEGMEYEDEGEEEE